MRQELTRSLGSIASSQGTHSVRWCQGEGYRNGRSSPNLMGSEEPKGRCCCMLAGPIICTIMQYSEVASDVMSNTAETDVGPDVCSGNIWRYLVWFSLKNMQ